MLLHCDKVSQCVVHSHHNGKMCTARSQYSIRLTPFPLSLTYVYNGCACSVQDMCGCSAVSCCWPETDYGNRSLLILTPPSLTDHPSPSLSLPLSLQSRCKTFHLTPTLPYITLALCFFFGMACRTSLHGAWHRIFFSC